MGDSGLAEMIGDTYFETYKIRYGGRTGRLDVWLQPSSCPYNNEPKRFPFCQS